MKSPHEFSERILLAVTGLSPQIVTETLYALTQVQQPAFVPTSIVVITTSEGANRICLELLGEDKAWFHRMRQEYELPDIRFNDSDIRVIEDEKGHPLSDIRTPEQNSRVADQVAEVVRELAQNKNTAIHASIAGGRKTMGFYLGYAMSLYGRPQDRLSHVLVDEGFEGHPEFYYPSKKQRTIYDRDGRPLDAAEAKVMLANIPFVRLRDGLPEHLLKGRSSFSNTVALAQKLYEPVSLEIDLAEQCLFCAGVPVKMTHADMAFYLFMANRALSGEGPIRWDNPQWRDQYLAAFRRVVSEYASEYEAAEKALISNKKNDDKNYFEQRKSRTNTALKTALGKRGAEPYMIQTHGPRGKSRFGLRIVPEAIRIRG